MGEVFRILLGSKKGSKEAVQVVDLGRTIRLPNGEEIDTKDILQILQDGTVIYVSKDGSIKRVRLAEEERAEGKVAVLA